VDFLERRHNIVSAIVSDDRFFELLVLKGGNALSLVHRIGGRASLDLDFSIEADLDEEIDAFGDRLQGALDRHFDPLGILVFDFRFEARPPEPKLDDWGGYVARFKLIPSTLAQNLAHDRDKMRSQSLEISPDGTRTYRVEISKHEYCEGKVIRQLDDVFVFVYTPAMIALEKLRALCQQHPSYPFRRFPTPRARDFFDIYDIVVELGVDLLDPSQVSFAQRCFAAKQVPFELLGDLRGQQDFHRQTWPEVEQAVPTRLEPFHFYFDFVIAQAENLMLAGE